MNSVDLKFFHAVVQASSIGGAALSLNTVQSNVTARIRSLEEEVGVPLFYRSRRGVTLTAAGSQLVPYAEKIRDLIKEATTVLTERENPAGPLRIGAMETTAALRLPPILIDYSRNYPKVDVQVETGPTETLIGRVLNRELDGAFVAGPVEHDELECLPIIAEELVVISSPRISPFDELRSADSSLKILAFRAGCAYRRRMDAFLSASGAVAVRWMELGTLDGIIGCVSSGVGIAMLPRSVVQDALSAGRVKAFSLPDEESKVTTLFINKKGSYSSPALQSFMRIAAQICSED